MTEASVRGVFERAAIFEAEAHALLETYEDAHQSRVIKLGDVLGRLAAVSLRQEALFEQALRCAANGLYLAAHVMAWAAFIDFYEEKLASDGLVKVHQAYTNWSGHKTLDDLRENIKEYQLIEAGKKIRLLTNGQMKALHGHLNSRNLAAHPTGFDPGINETLGYVESLIKLAAVIESKAL